jgi:hypothetical protein
MHPLATTRNVLLRGFRGRRDYESDPRKYHGNLASIRQRNSAAAALRGYWRQPHRGDTVAELNPVAQLIRQERLLEVSRPKRRGRTLLRSVLPRTTQGRAGKRHNQAGCEVAIRVATPHRYTNCSTDETITATTPR